MANMDLPTNLGNSLKPLENICVAAVVGGQTNQKIKENRLIYTQPITAPVPIAPQPPVTKTNEIVKAVTELKTTPSLSPGINKIINNISNQQYNASSPGYAVSQYQREYSAIQPMIPQIKPPTVSKTTVTNVVSRPLDIIKPEPPRVANQVIPTTVNTIVNAIANQPFNASSPGPGVSQYPREHQVISGPVTPVPITKAPITAAPPVQAPKQCSCPCPPSGVGLMPVGCPFGGVGCSGGVGAWIDGVGGFGAEDIARVVPNQRQVQLMPVPKKPSIGELDSIANQISRQMRVPYGAVRGIVDQKARISGNLKDIVNMAMADISHAMSLPDRIQNTIRDFYNLLNGGTIKNPWNGQLMSLNSGSKQEIPAAVASIKNFIKLLDGHFAKASSVKAQLMQGYPVVI